LIRTPVSSSDLASVGYDENLKILEIAFNSGGIYQYKNVPGYIYQRLMNASSKGKYFHRYIEGFYEYIKLN